MGLRLRRAAHQVLPFDLVARDRRRANALRGFPTAQFGLTLGIFGSLK